MLRWLLLAAAAVTLLVAVAVVLVPFRADLEVVGRNGRPVDLSLSVDCRAPILDAQGSLDPGRSPAASACQGPARSRSLGGLAAAVVGAGLLTGGLRQRGHGSSPTRKAPQ